MVEPVAPSADEGGGSCLGMEGRDLRRKNRQSAKIVGVNEYKHRFGRPTEFRGKRVRVIPNTHGGFVVGSIRDLQSPQLGHFEAQKDVGVSLGQQRWPPVHHLLDVGPDCGNVIFSPPRCGLGPLEKDPPLPNSSQSNPDLSRVCASLRDDSNLPRTYSTMEASLESV